MTLLEIFLVAVGLAMDAFGVAIGKGLMLTEGESYKKFVLSFLFPNCNNKLNTRRTFMQ